MSVKNQTLIKVKEAIQAGDLWKAKLSLQGMISQSYSTEKYELYGKVLFQLKDLLEAGKYLFLAGVKEKEFENSIDIYLKQYASNLNGLIASFPRKARLSKLTDYPDEVKLKLISLGVTEGHLKRFQPVHYYSPPSKYDKVMPFIFIGIAILVLACLGVGFVTILRWFLSLL